MITTEVEATELLQRLNARSYPIVGIDCETVGIDPKKEPASGSKGRIVCWSLAWYEGAANEGVAGLEIQSAVIWANDATWGRLGSALHSMPVTGHNIYGFDSHMFRKSGYSLGNIVGDTVRMSRLINTNDDAEHGLKALMKWWLHREPVGEFRELFKQRTCLGVEDESTIKYSWRTVAGDRVHSLIGAAHSRLGAGYSPVPLDLIPDQYPDLLPVLEEYAALDAVVALQLYGLFVLKMKDTVWSYPINQKD